ncbi:hypothetical protein THAOC_30479, partial [Thalassiosira oceanica]
MKIEVPESAWKVALPRALGPGITERALERPGKAREACFHRKFDSSLRRKLPLFFPAEDLDRVVRAAAARSRRGLQNRTKSSFLESARRALQITLDRRIQGLR